MYIGVYCCFSLVPLAFGVVQLLRRGRPWIGYTLLAVLSILVALVAFEGLSVVIGIRTPGVAQSWSYPGSYLGRGPLAWLIALLPPAGILAPLAIWRFTWGRGGNAD